MASGAAGLLAAVAALLCVVPEPGVGAAAAVWTAWLNVSWEDGAGGNRSGWEAGESGLYGQDSPLQAAAGLLVLPDGRDAFNACSALTNFSAAPPGGGPGWVALIQRGGGCSFADKIRLAAERGAAAAVIYNYRGTGNDVLPMSHAGAGSIVAIMIGNLKGMEILRRIESGLKVTMVIEVGKKHGPWMNHYSIFFVSVSFFIVTAATVGYFIFYSARRFRITRAQSRKQRQLKAEAKKAIGQLQLRTLKQGDKETGPDGDSCAVCIELYKPNEVVRILTCNHLFHKNCIDPWLLEHRTCPMCKCDILKVLGVEVDAEDGAESVQATVSSGTSNITSINEVDSHSETASSGYASVQGADESVLEEHAPSENDNTHLVNNESQTSAVTVLPPLDNPTFEADETQVSEVRS
ncbi:LOW QUALITY PROTEIN: E3 ubiquitin-protein ligase RNF128 isoform X1 [Gallus gallus]|uniref:Ring finger protein 128 n=1 Tax=Gallus gallus TaxID=9031 RepID=A0A8V0YGH2_CHICK|nr:LOW QUALITY PROTEIN: E3 ubiquitin-protein ligase RNF128 isoform X1 [Gallus gallus]XP_420351.3 E3 ubiquitin-protein ligase RNF128 isoform X1 [Gallus gallus]